MGKVVDLGRYRDRKKRAELQMKRAHPEDRIENRLRRIKASSEDRSEKFLQMCALIEERIPEDCKQKPVTFGEQERLLETHGVHGIYTLLGDATEFLVKYEPERYHTLVHTVRGIIMIKLVEGC